MVATSITPAWIIEDRRRRQHEREERERARVELPLPPPDYVPEGGREDGPRRSNVIIIELWS